MSVTEKTAEALGAVLSVFWAAGVVISASLGHLALFLAAAFPVFALQTAIVLKKDGAGRKLPAPLLGCALSAAALFAPGRGIELWYPVAVNAAFLILFAHSLASGVPVAERFARLSLKKGEELPEAAVSYCRGVTRAWCVFFILNGGVALATVLSGDMRAWGLWNGCLSYVFMGLMAGGEYLIRRRVRRND